jgi:hypothetical protein
MNAQAELLTDPEEQTVAADCQALIIALDTSIVSITDDSSYQAVCSRLKNASANIKAIEAYLKPLKERRYAAWKRLTTLEAKLTEPLQAIKTRDSRLVGAYQLEQQRKAQEEQRKAQLLAEQAATEARARQAEQLATEGRVAEGVALLDAPEVIPEPVYVAPTTPKVQGVSAPRLTYSVEVISLTELVKAVVEGRAPLGCVIPDQSALNKMASALKNGFSLPGCKLKVTAASSTRG